MKRFISLILAFGLIPALTACNPRPSSQPTPVVVSAAASLTDALKNAQAQFQANHAAIQLQFNFGSSGALQQQIEQGAPVDLFISAGQPQMDALVAGKLVDSAAVHTVVTNKVVLIRSAAATTVKGWTDLESAQVAKIAVGDPKHVPAGQYARTVLEKLGLWDHISGKLVYGEDVRGVLNYVESGDVQAGVVYQTDAASSPKVTVVAEAPAGSYPPVIYPMAVLKDAEHASQAKAFADFLLSPAGKTILKKYGFGVGD